MSQSRKKQSDNEFVVIGCLLNLSLVVCSTQQTVLLYTVTAVTYCDFHCHSKTMSSWQHTRAEGFGYVNTTGCCTTLYRLMHMKLYAWADGLQWAVPQLPLADTGLIDMKHCEWVHAKQQCIHRVCKGKHRAEAILVHSLF